MALRGISVLPVEYSWTCSYTPRSIQLSRDSGALFVGCKDGTIAVVDGIAGPKTPASRDQLISSRLPPPSQGDEPKVRAMVDLGRGWLLAGRQDGRLYLHPWRAKKGGKRQVIGRLAAIGEDRRADSDPVTYLEWLDHRHVIASFRNGGTWILDGARLQEELTDLETRGRGTAFVDDVPIGDHHRLSGVDALCSTAPIDGDGGDTQWLLASATGELWLAGSCDGSTPPVPVSQLWSFGERPGWVNDYAVVKRWHPDESRRDFFYGDERGRGIYLATDIGVYHARSFGGGVDGLRLRRVSLPGFGGMCIALAHFAAEDYDYLWASDTTGVHLFWSDRKPDGDEPYWRRLGIRHEETIVMLAVGSWRTLGEGFVIGQARRPETITVSVYLSDDGLRQVPDSLRKTSRPRFRQVLADTDLERLGERYGSHRTEASSPESDLADFFEQAGKEPRGIQLLIEELSNPTIEVALRILKTSEEPERAIAPWTHALLGTIHRRAAERSDSQCLGVIRWLRALGSAYTCLPPGEAPRMAKVRAEIEENIRFVRKWGLFGRTFGPDGSTWKQRWALRNEAGRHDSPRSSTSLDRLVYESQFFDRGVDLEIEDSSFAALGRTAWDLRTLETTAGQYLIAVSWASGGIRVHRYRPLRIGKPRKGSARPPEIVEPEICRTAVLLPAGDGALVGRNDVQAVHFDDGRNDPHGHSRRILLGKLADRTFFLVTAPTRETGSEKVQIWRLDEDGRLPACTGDAPGAPDCEIEISGSAGASLEGESVYTMLQLEETLVLLGLRGVGGTPKILLLKIDTAPDLRLKLYRPAQPLLVNFPEAKVQTRNRVWAMTRDHRESTGAGERHVVFVGCEDGQVLRLELPHSSGLDGDTFDLKRDEHQSVVDRLGVPVWALACRRTRRRGGFRVFAGGADGTIVGWQERESEDGLRVRFAPLWATVEQKLPITWLHTLDYPAEIHPRTCAPLQEGDTALVLAVAQNGRVVFFDDQEKADRPRDCKHHRLSIPGVRYGRPRLGATSFASSVIREDSAVHLVSATSDGRIRVYVFDYLLHRERRPIQHGELVQDWKREVASGGKGSGAAIDSRRLRLVESTFAASPALSRILVRWLLESDYLSPEQGTWLPHHLRPLFDLVRDHRVQASGIPSEEGVKALESALERTCALRDENLFVEIVAVVMRRTNEALFDPVRSRLVNAADYGYLLNAIERTIQHWIGDPELAQRIQIMFAKHMIDGDALWHMACEARQEPGGHDFTAILQRRVSSIRYLLVTGQVMLALETLRASNLALARACLRLQGPREHGWKPKHELDWVGMETFFKALTDFASRAANSKTSINDALKLEIVRSYALGLCACPSAAIRIAQWMSEANLILAQESYEDFSSLVRSQCDLLNSIGITVPRFADDLFRRATSTKFERSLNLDPEQWNDFPETILPETWEAVSGLIAVGRVSPPRRRLLEVVELLDPCIGRFNAQSAAGMTIFNCILVWLHDLTGRFTGDAKDIDLRPALYLARILTKGWEPPDGEAEISEMWKHSREFWSAALRAFIKKIFAGRKPPKRVGVVRPEILLLSRDIASWCKESLEELKWLFEQLRIFHPQYDLYGDALRQLQQAAQLFPRSAAVQTNLVLGVLDHGLLESMDEHVLELTEIAQCLDPLMAKSYHRRGHGEDDDLGDIEDDSRPAAESFARYLLRRSTDAEGIPKNLRTLHSILDFASSREDYSDGNGRDDVSSLLGEFSAGSFEWRQLAWRSHPLQISRVERRFLRLTLSELANNDVTHGLKHGVVGVSNCPYTPWYSVEEGSSLTLHFEYDPNHPSGELERRVGDLKVKELQELLHPRKNRNIASNGMGLYLANLAAAIVNWELTVDESSGKGKLDFRLVKKG